MLRASRPDGSGWDGVFASITTFIAVLALAKNFLPPEWIRLVRRFCYKLTDFLNPYATFTITEFTNGSVPERIYDQVKLYLSGRGTHGASRVVVTHPKNSARALFAMVCCLCVLAASESIQQLLAGRHSTKACLLRVQLL